MATSGRPDVIEVLKKERDYHMEQVKRINMALAVLEGEVTRTTDDKPETRKIEWTAEILKLFDEFEQLDFEQARNKLAERGVPEGLESRYRNTIYTTLKRKVDEGVLVKGANKVYSRKGGGASIGSDPPK
jgi:hypothetical protein